MKLLLILLIFFTINCEAQDTTLHICTQGHISKIDKGKILQVIYRYEDQTHDYFTYQSVLMHFIKVRKGKRIKVLKLTPGDTLYYSTYYRTILNPKVFNNK